MIKEKDKGGGARLKDEPSDPTEPGHGSRPPSASLPTPAALKKEPDDLRVKMEGHQTADEQDLGVDSIKTEIDGLIDGDGDPTKSPSCELGGPGSLKSERLSSDSNDILDPQTGLRSSSSGLQDTNPSCRNPGVGPEMGSCRLGGGGPMVASSLANMAAGDAQVLPSNVISKQAGSMEQQSQIFVFSTHLANKGAEAVLSGLHHSIIAYHCAQPGTKKYLEKHPLKMGQFNKQSPAAWLNTLALAKTRRLPGRPSGMEQHHEGEIPWENKNPSMMANGMSNGPGQMCDGPDQNADGQDPNHHGPKGVKIPDENLTPQQRAHREEQLATIRKMQQMLFPESGNPAQGNPDNQQNDMNTPNSAANMNMGFPPGNMNIGPMGPQMGPNGPMGPQMGPNGPMGPNMGPNGPMGPNMGPNMGPMNSMNQPSCSMAGPMGGMGMGPMGGMPGSMGPNGMMGGMMGVGPCGGPCGKPRPDHSVRPCGPNMGRMPNPMGMGGPKPCMMGGPHMGPRMMPSHNMNAMNGGMMMEGGMMHGDCGDHLAPPTSMCDDYPRRSMVGEGVGRGGRSPKSPAGEIDWQKIHHQFFDDKNMDQDLGHQVKSPCSERGGCLPPPPYGASPLHRSASVPIATQSPSHSSVQMPMSADGSRTNSAINSPASQHCKMNNKNNDPPEILEKLDDGVFVRTLQCLAAQQQKNQVLPQKEPSLMPVPSPQQITYLNQFEGQELTIQKQPNTSLKDGSGGSSGGQTPQQTANQKSPAGMMPGTPDGSMSEQRGGRFSLEQSPGFNNPQTPTSVANNEKSRPSPSSNRSSQDSASKTPQREMNQPYTPSSSSSSTAMKSSCSVAQTKCDDVNTSTTETPMSGGPNSTALPAPFPGSCSMNRPDNIPINPNQASGGSLGLVTSSFDPISSLAQMSQQLTSVGGNYPPPHLPHHHPLHQHPHSHMMINEMGCHMDSMGGPGMGPMEGMMGGDFPPDMSLSPKMGAGPMGGGMGPMGPDPSLMGPRMPGKMPPFNGANVQVKASAPNTIQYLPTRPQMPCNSGPRGPPSLDFLQRVTNPMQMDASKGYFPGNRMMEDSSVRARAAAAARGQYGYSPPRDYCPAPPYRLPRPSPPVRLPMPPPHFKGQGFNVPSTADPNYAAQFHNFQQQLYATGNRGGPQQHPQYPPYQQPK